MLVFVRKGFAVAIAFLLVMAWQNRNNRAIFFFAVGGLFGVAAMLTADRVPDAILHALALGWALCMLVVAVSGAARLAARLRKRAKQGNESGNDDCGNDYIQIPKTPIPKMRIPPTTNTTRWPRRIF